MLSLIIIKEHYDIQIENINTPFIKIGNNLDSDIVIRDLNGKGLHLTIDNQQAILREACKGEYSKKKGPWGKKVKQDSLYYLEGYRFFLTFLDVKQKDITKNFKINIDNLPKDPSKKNYASNLLDFFTESIGAKEAAMFLYQNQTFKILATKNLKIKDHGQFFLKEYFLNIKENSVTRVSFDTHTLLFKAGLKPKNFLIAKSNINNNDAVFLYIPDNKIENAFQKQILSVLLYLTAQSLLLHILCQQRYKSRSSIEGGMFWGNSTAMRQVKELTDRVASTDLSILIEGETGVGKEKLVEYIAKKSLSPHIVSVNCSAIPQHLVESLLFGHVKGAFTGADNNQIGKIQEAHNGILFLDEIAELPLDVQAKLLRVLQDLKITPIGGKESSVNFRLIAASHQNLQKLISKGLFREDLYFRINEVLIKIPPLRERSQDIISLAELFIMDYCNKNNLGEKYISTDLSHYIRNYSWPGNIRELKSFIRKGAVFSDDKYISLETIEKFQPSSNQRQKEFNFDLRMAKKDFLANHINQVLQHCNGNKTQAAKLLNISLRSFFRMISELKNDGFILESDNFDIPNQPNISKSHQSKLAQDWQS